MKKKTKKSSVLIYIIVGTIAVIAGLYAYKNKANHPQLEQTKTYCNDFDRVTDTIKTSLNGDYKITVRDVPIPKESEGFFWRRSLAEPVVSYPALKNRVIYLYTQPSQKTAKQFEDIAVPALESLGLIRENLNNIPYAESTITVGGSGSYGFVKEEDRYMISLNGAYANDILFNSDGTAKQEIQLPQNSSGISIMCGISNPSYDDIYNKIIKTGIYSTEQKISIIEIKDRVVRLNVSSVGGFGGAGSYWLLDNNKAEQLIKETQQPPSCDIFESKKIGKGLSCYDTNTGTMKTANY